MEIMIAYYKCNNHITYPADVERIIGVVHQMGFSINEHMAIHLWEDFSSSMSACWLSLPEDDEMLKTYLIDYSNSEF